MERITAEEAKEYISCKDDFTSDDIDNAEYFTLTPSLKGEGWEDVTYFTKRPTTMYANRDGDFDSWVYIMSNPSSPGYYKIGYTKKSPEERAKQISNATGVIVPMVVEWAFHCYNGFALEQEVHNKLDAYRVSNQREFFQISLDEARQTVEEIGSRYI
jgi:hypothetical protein|tara:strand:+ start:1678 stop:2151 length:474 start_codon:yes stop_codon:yes gene_type:complete